MTLKQRKPFKCPQCSYSSAHNFVFRQHITRHSTTFDYFFDLRLCDDHILTILSFQKYIKTLSSGIIRFWAHTSHHIRVDFFFSMFLCFLVFDDPHLFLYSSKIVFYFLSLFPPLIHLALHPHDICTAYCLYCHFLSYQLL